MRHRLVKVHAHALRWRSLVSEEALALLLVASVFAMPAAAMRFQERSLLVHTNEPSAVSRYTVSFRYMSPASVGSVDMLFCDDPIPYHPCVTPPGLNVSNATLASQSGETGFSILSKTNNRIVLSRMPSLIASAASSYTFSGIINPKNSGQTLSIRLKSHGTTNATGPQIDFGSVRSQINTGVTIQTQVPPMLIFCLAQEVQENCGSTNETYFTDMGQLTPRVTLTAQSEMAVGTNASGGFAITANGTPPAAGTNVIDSPTIPTENKIGSNQFGINLVENNAPRLGKDPEGEWANAVAAPGYNTPNRYKYVSGDTVAYSPNVSLMKKFTVSYVLNSRQDLRPGVYTTTITYIASGRF